VTRRGFGLVIGVAGLLKTVATIDYRAIANSHMLLHTMAHVKSSTCPLSVAWQRIPAMSSASVLTWLPAGYHLAADHQLATHCL
jgi:hypothetical protein